MIEEKWLPFPNYEHMYLISNHGRVKTLRGGGLIKLSKTPNGYSSARLYRPGVSGPTRCSVHRAVAIAFLPNKNNLPVVAHLDGNKENNHINNLSWATHKENSGHMKIHGTSISGNKHHNIKLKEEYRAVIMNIYNNNKGLFGLKAALARKYNVSLSTISRMIASYEKGQQCV